MHGPYKNATILKPGHLPMSPSTGNQRLRRSKPGSCNRCIPKAGHCNSAERKQFTGPCVLHSRPYQAGKVSQYLSWYLATLRSIDHFRLLARGGVFPCLAKFTDVCLVTLDPANGIFFSLNSTTLGLGVTMFWYLLLNCASLPTSSADPLWRTPSWQ